MFFSLKNDVYIYITKYSLKKKQLQIQFFFFFNRPLY